MTNQPTNTNGVGGVPSMLRMLRYVFAFGIVQAIATPALAASFYVVRGLDNKCRVVEVRPVDKTIFVFSAQVYITREEAEAQIKVLCNDYILRT